MHNFLLNVTLFVRMKCMHITLTCIINNMKHATQCFRKAIIVLSDSRLCVSALCVSFVTSMYCQMVLLTSTHELHATAGSGHLFLKESNKKCMSSRPIYQFDNNNGIMDCRSAQ